jgi:hypothetical protein
MTSGSMMGLLGASLLIAAAGRLVLQRANLALPWRAGAVALLLLAGGIPAGGLPAAAYVRGVVGDLSLPTLLLLAASLASYVLGRRLVEARERAAWFAVVIAAALFLYPMALGLGGFDPYALGYGSHALATALLLLTLAAWAARCHYAVLGVLAAVAAFLAGLLDSTNLWDYLIDPLLAGYALFWWLRRAAGMLSAPAPGASN